MRSIHKLRFRYSVLAAIFTLVAMGIDMGVMDRNAAENIVFGDMAMVIFAATTCLVLIWNIDSLGNNTDTTWAWGRAAIAIAIYCVAIEIARIEISIWNLIPVTKFMVFYVYPFLVLSDFATGIWLEHKIRLEK